MLFWEIVETNFPAHSRNRNQKNFTILSDKDLLHQAPAPVHHELTIKPHQQHSPALTIWKIRSRTPMA